MADKTPKERTKYMEELYQELLENGLAKSTAANYIQVLKRYNGGEVFDNLEFLKHEDLIFQKLSNYAESTQRNNLAIIISALTCVINVHLTYRKAFDSYKEKLDKILEEDKKKPKNLMTEKQEKNWISMEQIKKIRDEKIKEIEKYNIDDDLTRAQWSNLLQALLLGLYTFISPRRNKDYMHMYVVRKPMAQFKQDIEKNYYFPKDGVFSFNAYKTSKTYGNKIINISDNEPLVDLIDEYLKLHPNNRYAMYPFLVNFYGEPFVDSSSINQILNRAFKQIDGSKRVGSSMIRHIYLSDAFADEDKKRMKIADDMGHSIDMQRQYIIRPKNKESDAKAGNGLPKKIIVL